MENPHDREEVLAELMFAGLIDVQDRMLYNRSYTRAEGEWVYPVTPLAVPAEDAEAGDDLLRYGGVQLFVERLRAAEPHFAPNRPSAAMIAAICRRLDGIPLAIELAAARAAVLGVEEVAAHLDDRFRILTGGRRTALPRHQTLRATLDWSCTAAGSSPCLPGYFSRRRRSCLVCCLTRWGSELSACQLASVSPLSARCSCCTRAVPSGHTHRRRAARQKLSEDRRCGRLFPRQDA